MNWFTELFTRMEKSDWRLCTQVDADYISRLKLAHPDYSFHDAAANETDYTYTYYLYEDQHGNRKFDVIDTQNGDIDIKTLPKDSFVYRITEYRNKIRPWLDGRCDPDIPTWEQVPVNDFARALKGKK